MLFLFWVWNGDLTGSSQQMNVTPGLSTGLSSAGSKWIARGSSVSSEWRFPHGLFSAQGERPRCGWVFGSRWGLGCSRYLRRGRELCSSRLSLPQVSLLVHTGGWTRSSGSITCGAPGAQGPEAGHVLWECGWCLVTAMELSQAVLLLMWTCIVRFLLDSSFFHQSQSWAADRAGGRIKEPQSRMWGGTGPAPLSLSCPQQPECFPGSAGMSGKQDTKALSAFLRVSPGPHPKLPLPGMAPVSPCSQPSWHRGWGDAKEGRGDVECQCPWGARADPSCSISTLVR